MRKLTLLACIIYLTSPSYAQNANHQANAYLQKALRRVSERTVLPGATGVRIGVPALASALVVDGKIVAVAAIGNRFADSASPVELDDAFHIGSVAKPVTGFLTSILIRQKIRVSEHGVLTWKTTLYDVFPELWDDPAHRAKRNYKDLTLAQLMAHETGMPYNPSNWSVPSVNEGFNPDPKDVKRRRWEFVRAVVKETPLITPKYGGGSIVVAAMLERLTGKTYEELLAENVLSPLGMANTGFGVPLVKKIPYAAEHGIYSQTTIPIVTVLQAGNPAGQTTKPESTPLAESPAELIAPTLEQPQALPPTQLSNSTRWRIEPRAYPPAYDTEPHAPAGRNLFMSVSDLARFAAANLPGSPLLSNDDLILMQTRYGPFGFTNGGWGVGGSLLGANSPTVGHSGCNGFNLSQVIVAPEQNAALVAMTNVGNEQRCQGGEFGSRAVGQVMGELQALRRHLPAIIASERAVRNEGISAIASNSFPSNPACGANAHCGPESLIDGDLTTRWAANTRNAYVVINLPTPQAVAGLIICESIYERVRGFQVSVEVNGEWTVVSDGQEIGPNKRVDFDAVITQKVRLTITEATEAPTLTEIMVLGK